MEYWDVYDKSGVKLGYTKRSDEVFSNGEYHLGASVWIVDRAGRLLIQKRAAVKKTYPNCWSITGGKVTAGEDSAAACIREVKEEIGLTLHKQDITFLYRSIGSDMLFDDYIAKTDFSIDQAILRSSEVSELKWADIDEIVSLYRHHKFMYNNISDLSVVRNYLSNLHLTSR